MTSGLPSPYTRFDTLRAIIEDDPALLTIINRFDIALGFGDSTVESVCTDNGVDTDTFLAVVNFNAGRRWEGFEVSLRQLIGYLRRSHTHFINFALPTIKRMLIDGLHEAPTSEISMVILRFLDSYIADVRAHMDYEDRAIFAYVERLLDGDLSGDPGISEFSSRHVHMASKLDDLKELFIYKFRQRNNEAINAALHQLMLTGTELIRHCEVENIMLLPRVARLEREVRESLEATSVPVTEQEAPRLTCSQSARRRCCAALPAASPPRRSLTVCVCHSTPSTPTAKISGQSSTSTPSPASPSTPSSTTSSTSTPSNLTDHL